MTIHSIIRTLLLIQFFLFVAIISAQQDTADDLSNVSTSSSFFGSDERQNLFAVFVGGHRTFTSGDNFMGEGLEGKFGVNFKAHMYVYKNLFIGVSTGVSNLDVKNQELVGNYERTRISENYFYFGYEFLPAKEIRLGVNISFDGDLKYKNTGFSGSDEFYQYDSAKLNRYGVYFNYEISRYFRFYLDYGYNISKTNIEVPSELENFFSKGAYSTVGIGLVFAIGRRDLISRYID